MSQTATLPPTAGGTSEPVKIVKARKKRQSKPKVDEQPQQPESSTTVITGHTSPAPLHASASTDSLPRVKRLVREADVIAYHLSTTSTPNKPDHANLLPGSTPGTPSVPGSRTDPKTKRRSSSSKRSRMTSQTTVNIPFPTPALMLLKRHFETRIDLPRSSTKPKSKAAKIPEKAVEGAQTESKTSPRKKGVRLPDPPSSSALPPSPTLAATDILPSSPAIVDVFAGPSTSPLKASEKMDAPGIHATVALAPSPSRPNLKPKQTRKSQEPTKRTAATPKSKKSVKDRVRGNSISSEGQSSDIIPPLDDDDEDDDEGYDQLQSSSVVHPSSPLVTLTTLHSPAPKRGEDETPKQKKKEVKPKRKSKGAVVIDEGLDAVGDPSTPKAKEKEKKSRKRKSEVQGSSAQTESGEVPGPSSTDAVPDESMMDGDKKKRKRKEKQRVDATIANAVVETPLILAHDGESTPSAIKEKTKKSRASKTAAEGNTPMTGKSQSQSQDQEQGQASPTKTKEKKKRKRASESGEQDGSGKGGDTMTPLIEAGSAIPPAMAEKEKGKEKDKKKRRARKSEAKGKGGASAEAATDQADDAQVGKGQEGSDVVRTEEKKAKKNRKSEAGPTIDKEGAVDSPAKATNKGSKKQKSNTAKGPQWTTDE